MSTRINNSLKNFTSSLFYELISKFLKFFIRTLFIKKIGIEFLGVDGLFANILGVLSFADLGVGTAISFSLYKPLAENNHYLIAQIIAFYKKACRIIAVVILTLGLLVIPFLPLLAKSDISTDKLTIIYCIFLLDSVLSYLISYSTVLLSADQKNYIISSFHTTFLIVISVLQLLTIQFTRNYILYLLCGVIIGLVEKIGLFIYVKKRYAYISNKTDKLPQLIKKEILHKIYGLSFHKFGEIAIYQTDNIITSTIINVSTVGLVSNYSLIVKTVSDLVNTLISSVSASLGNFIVTENIDDSRSLFNIYDFITSWIYGVCTVCLFTLLTPFVCIWIGADKAIDNTTVFLLCLNFYLLGNRSSVGNMKAAAGIFEQDRWVPIAEAVTNIIISIIGAKALGLKGIYLGTVISGLFPSFVHPFYLYKYVLKKSSKEYYIKYFYRVVLISVSLFLVGLLLKFNPCDDMFGQFLYSAFICIVLPNIILVIGNCKTDEYKNLKFVLRNMYENYKNRKNKGAES